MNTEAQGERRLHPLSWLFVLVAQLKQFIVPLLVLLFVGRGDRNDLWALVAVGVLALVSVFEYFTYRYRIHHEGLTIRSGWLHRSVREVPFARIHNVNLQQTLLHRLFGVAEVRLESAGGVKPEAQMRVLRMDDALALEALVRRRTRALAAGDGEAAAEPASHTLLALDTGELLRLGLISNRGMLLVAAAMGALAQTGENVFGALMRGWGDAVFGWVGSHAQDDPRLMLLFAGSLLVAAFLALRLLSVLLALLQYHGFTLSEHDTRLTVERGLLARVRSSARRQRIQAWTLVETWLHRRFGRRELRIDTASLQQGNGSPQASQALRELAPIATPQRCDALIAHLLPDSGWDALDWQPLHRDAWKRIAIGGVLFALLLAGVLAWRFGAWGALGLLWLPWALLRARRVADNSGWACNGRIVAVRSGWFSKSWRFAEIGKLQVIQRRQSPLDRRWGMGKLLLDTCGANAMGPPLELRHVPAPLIDALAERLGAQVAATRLQW